MYAITFPSPGPPEVLTWSRLPDPTPARVDVLIDVVAAGVNNADLLQRRGLYPVPFDAPPTLGLECSGTISWVGRGACGWKVGDRVCALLSGGGYAEQVAAPWDLVLPVPAGVDIVHAAALPEAACTVFSNLSMTARLHSGMSLLVHGGGSGIGTFTIQWGKAIGTRVLTTRGECCKAQQVRGAGSRRTDQLSRS